MINQFVALPNKFQGISFEIQFSWKSQTFQFWKYKLLILKSNNTVEWVFSFKLWSNQNDKLNNWLSLLLTATECKLEKQTRLKPIFVSNPWFGGRKVLIHFNAQFNRLKWNSFLFDFAAILQFYLEQEAKEIEHLTIIFQFAIQFSFLYRENVTREINLSKLSCFLLL